MESADVIALLDQLDDNVDDLEEALAPILGSTVLETSKKLPVLDKAKFHVMITYALESLIFSYLRLRGVNSKEHPVFRELTRVKQYFDKIKSLETEPEERKMVLDKQAAGRFIKHGLAGNEKLDLQREEQLAKEKARAQLKASLLAKRATETPEASSKQDSDDSDVDADSDDEPDLDAKSTEQQQDSVVSKSQRRKRNKKNKSKSSGGEGAKHKQHRSKEERRERHKERRKKKEEARSSRKAT
ncbi:Sas10/Utp3/C1D family-domain-containing protein [Aspergillus egyptiacus]|nr:Sas10/Utp3/C1D family-domain-containing protein [Aspergillus egyptiacus]